MLQPETRSLEQMLGLRLVIGVAWCVVRCVALLAWSMQQREIEELSGGRSCPDYL
jgi:hypothetical protein